MTSLLSFSGRMRRLPYALGSSALFFSQHAAVLLASPRLHVPPRIDAPFWIMPLRSLAAAAQPFSDLWLLAALTYGLIVAYGLAALAFRRAADAGVSEWIAAAALVPVIQVPVILLLSLIPPSAAAAAPAAEPGGAAGLGRAAAAQGLIAGIGLTLFAVAVATLVFGAYGYGLFIVSPFVIGAVTAYLANRRGDIGAYRTAKLVTGAIGLGGLALVAVALEGIVCIVLAAPLGLGAALLGGLLGRAIAASRRGSAAQAFSSLAFLPIVYGLEYLLPPTTRFETRQSIAIDAPPAAVWASLVRMDTIEEPLALPFRLGVAYPVRGEVFGEGVGAVRRGEFSTGTAIERVTEWIPERKLAFAVVTDVPAMRELSPYRHVHAPHAVGYFRTIDTSFELTARPGGGTDVIERTSHELKLDPVFYWLPLARWIVGANNARVLAHVRHQAERAAR